KTVVAPLDRVRILFQTQHTKYAHYASTRFGMFRAGASIYREYGMRGLFQGYSMQLARVFPYAAVELMTYEQLKRRLGQHIDDKNLRNFLAGSLCGVISVAVSYPLDMVRVRMAYNTPDGAQQRQSILQVVRTIYTERAYRFGLFNFFRGFPLTVAGIVPYGGVSFLTREYLRELACTRFAHIAALPPGERKRAGGRRRKMKELKSWAELAVGGLTGVFAQTASYPFELLRRKMQVAGAHDPNSRASVVKVAGDLWHQSGVRGFFVGLTIGYVKMVPMTAVFFFTYEKLKAVFDLE
ncbi:coenzyme A transporter, partial [Linderina pennispora]